MLRWMDGFEHYGTIAHMIEGVGGGAAWSEVDSTSFSLSTANPATGTTHLRLADDMSGKAILRRVWGVSKQVVGHGYRFTVENLPTREGLSNHAALVLAEVRDASNVHQFMLVLGTDGSIFAVRGADFDDVTGGLGGTTLGRSDPCVTPGGYHHFEWKAKIDNSTGYIEVRVNEVTVLNLTGIDTQSTANAHAAQVIVGVSQAQTATNVGFGVCDIDDVFAWDDDATDATNTIVDFVGDKGAYYLKPNADTATNTHTLNGSATAYGALDEVPPNGTDYLSTASATARTIVGLEALPANTAEVIAIMPVIYAKKLDSGSVTYRGGVVSGASETYGPDDNPSTEYAYLRPGPKTIDPATLAPWAANATPKLLIERTA